MRTCKLATLLGSDASNVAPNAALTLARAMPPSPCDIVQCRPARIEQMNWFSVDFR